MKTPLFLLSAALLVGVVGCGSGDLPPESRQIATTAGKPLSSIPVKPSRNDQVADNASRVYQTKDLQRVTLKLPRGKVEAWIMDDFGKRQEGMMFLTDKEVRNDQGMLFLFKEVQYSSDQRAFWMHNTPLPLDIIYIGPTNRVVSVGKGMPMNDNPVNPKGDYKYVLELKQGQAKRYGIETGTVITIPKEASAKD